MSGAAPANSHAARRLAERYGVALTKRQMGDLIERVRAGAGVVVDKSRDTERRLIAVEGRDVIVVWHPGQSRIVTVVPVKRLLPPLRKHRKSRDGKTKSEGKRPEPREEME